MCTHLAKRGSRYYFRRKIPLDLTAHYPGREVMRSLGTSDRREATRLARILGVELDREFDRLRGRHSLPDGHQPAESVLPEHGLRNTESRSTSPAPEQGDLSPHERVRKGLEAVLSRERSGGAATQFGRSNVRGEATAALPNARTSFETLIDKWAAGVQPEQNTVSRTRMHARRFKELAGAHSIEEVTRQHAIQFVEQLQKAGQTPQNINMHLASVIKLLNYAVRLGLIGRNEASGLTVKAPSGEKPRRSFDLIALKGIFSSPVFTEGHRPKGGGGNASYWLPLLALFTGARLEELCQLHPDDVMQSEFRDGDIDASSWVIRITDEGEGQGLKNAGSRRRIPLHPELERLGFVEYAMQAKSEHRRRIFHELVTSVDGKEGGNFSKWFGRYLRKTCKIEDKRMVFHSFRHLFKEALREAEIPKEINDALTGHESGDVGDKYGGDAYPLRPLVNAIKRYRIPGLTLPAPRLVSSGGRRK